MTRPYTRRKPLPPRDPWSNTASPITRQLLAIIAADPRTMADITPVIGVTEVGLSRWRRGKASPRLFQFECAAEALGYRLVLEKIS